MIDLMAGKVFIELEGGLVVSVFSDDPNCEVTIIDHDTEGMDEDELEEHDERVEKLKQAQEDGEVTQIY